MDGNINSFRLKAWAPGDYENWEGTLIKLGGYNINLGGTYGQN